MCTPFLCRFSSLLSVDCVSRSYFFAWRGVHTGRTMSTRWPTGSSEKELLNLTLSVYLFCMLSYHVPVSSCLFSFTRLSSVSSFLYLCTSINHPLLLLLRTHHSSRLSWWSRYSSRVVPSVMDHRYPSYGLVLGNNSERPSTSSEGQDVDDSGGSIPQSPTPESNLRVLPHGLWGRWLSCVT